MNDLPLCIAVRNGRRPTVFYSMDEAIFSIYGWPDADYKKCTSAEDVLLYMKMAPLEYPRWFRLLVCPETKDDLTEPTITEASSEEFRQTFRLMRMKGFPETRFPAWFMEKIRQEDREQADRDVQAPTQAPRPGQSNVPNDFGPEDLSTRTWKSPTIQSRAKYAVRGLQSRMQLSLSTQEQQTERRLLYDIRTSSQDHGQRPSVSSSLDPAQQHPLLAQTGSSNPQEDLNTKISRWRLITESCHDPGEPKDKPEDEASSYDDDVRIELEPLMWAFSSATLDLTPTSAMILGSPGRPSEDWAQSFNPATDQVDLWGITEKEVQLQFVNECLGPIANRYFNLHYYSQASKAVFVQAYCLHRGCFGDFLQHVFRRGVLPRIAVYVWELLGRSFNWKAVLKAGIAVRDLAPSGSSNVDVPAKTNLNFGECSECKGNKLVVRSAGKIV